MSGREDERILHYPRRDLLRGFSQAVSIIESFGRIPPSCTLRQLLFCENGRASPISTKSWLTGKKAEPAAFEPTTLDPSDEKFGKDLVTRSRVVVGNGQQLIFKNCGLDVYRADGTQIRKYSPSTGQGIVNEGIEIVIIVGKRGGFREEIVKNTVEQC